MDTTRFQEEDFNSFLHEVIVGNHLEPTALGITKLVIDKGFESLTSKQKHVFLDAIHHHYYDECNRCSNDIPWSEMYVAEISNGQCSWCVKLSDNDK